MNLTRARSRSSHRGGGAERYATGLRVPCLVRRFTRAEHYRDSVRRRAGGRRGPGLIAVGIVVFTSHGVPALRAALRGIRETVADPWELAVYANDCSDLVATYLVRQYLRGRIGALELDSGAGGGHCGLDRVFHLVEGEHLVRVDDTLQFEVGWLERSIAALEADPAIGCLSLVQPPDYHRGRGRPRTVHVEPVIVDHLDMRCFVTRRELVARHECGLVGEDEGGSCRFQEFLLAHGKKLAYLPGVVTALALSEVPSAQDACAHEADLPAHEGASGAMQHLQQAYQLGDDVLLTCMACGGRRARSARRPHPLLRAAPGGHRVLVRAPLPRVQRASLQGRLPVQLPGVTRVVGRRARLPTKDAERQGHRLSVPRRDGR